MNVNKPISRRKALKVMGLGMLAACVPTLPSFGESPKENEKKTKRLIFYFSATGNSLYIARQLGGDEATLLSISQEIHNEHPDYEAEEIGFVCLQSFPRLLNPKRQTGMHDIVIRMSA